MAMDLEQRADDRMHVRWGKAEGWIFGGLAALVMLLLSTLIAVFSYYGKAVNQSLGEQSNRLAAVETKVAVSNAQMTTLSSQLADVPALTRQMAELNVQVERNTQDISELRRLRGLR